MAKTRNSTRKNGPTQRDQKLTNQNMMRDYNEDSKSIRSRHNSPDFLTNSQLGHQNEKKNRISIQSNDDIDIYFDKSIQTSKGIPKYDHFLLDKSFRGPYTKKEFKSNFNQPIKQQLIDRIYDPLNFSFKNLNESQKIDLQPESPIFGRKDIHSFMVPSNKLQQFKIYDQYQSQVLKKDLIDHILQSENKQPEIQSNNINANQFQIEETPIKNLKRMTKKEKNLCKKTKIKTKNIEKLVNRQDYSLKSFKILNGSFIQNSLKRRASILTVSALTKINCQMDKACRTIKMINTTLDNIAHYHQLRQIHHHLLNFRKKMHCVFKQLFNNQSKIINKNIELKTLLQKRYLYQSNAIKAEEKSNFNILKQRPKSSIHQFQ